MDSYLRRQRRRLLDDLVDLQREEDLQRQSRSIMSNRRASDGSRSDSDDDEYRDYHHRRQEYCLVKLTYRNPSTRRQRHVDEITVTQHNRTLFKGCLKNGDQFTFKSKRYRNQSKLKLQFYVNDLLEDEIRACCEHGLIDRNRSNHLFHIEQIIGSKPCYECEFDKNASTLSSPTSNSPSRQNSSTQVKPPESISRSSRILSEDESSEQKPKVEKSTLPIPQTHNDKASSEGFSGDITEFSDFHIPTRNQQESDEDSIDFLPIKTPPPTKRTYGPPQLSTMLSVTETFDTPISNIREQTNATVSRSNSVNQSGPNVSLINTQLFRSLSSNAESIQIDPSTRTSLTNPNDLAMANDATQLLLTQLGIIRQQQVERPEVSSGIPPREKGNVEHFILVYLNSSYPDESTTKHLRHLVNLLKFFNDIDDCVAFINSISHERILLILSSSYVNSILPRIEELQQIFKIYILSDDAEESSSSSKIQGTYSNINDIYKQISNDINKITRDLIIFLNSSPKAVTLQSVFIHFHLLIELILDKTGIKDNYKELIDFSRHHYDGNDEELKLIDEFEKTYRKSQAMDWFYKSCFISKMLNKAFSIPEDEILYKFRLFIQDLRQQIQIESVSNSITVYLGQTIQRNHLNNLQQNILDNNLITFPNFLFGSTNQSRAVRIAKDIPVLAEGYKPLVIRVDIPEGMKCAIKNSFDDDNDVLLNMGLMGRITKIENDDEVAWIHLTTVRCENQRNIQEILEIKRAEIKSISSFVELIKLMILMNKQTSAEQMVEAMFDDEDLKTDTGFQISLASAYSVLASSRRDEQDYRRALELFLLSLNTFARIISPTSVELCTLYINIATMYFRVEEYDKSQEYHQKALDIQLRSATPDLRAVSAYTNSMGIVYLKQGKYPEALKAFKRTLKVLEQYPEPDDNELSSTYDNIGDAYLSQGKYEEALDNYIQSLAIEERIEPRKPQVLGSSCNTIGNIYLKLGRSKEALTHLKRALEYQQEYLPPNDSSFVILYNNIGLMYYNEEEFSEALKSYSKSLEVASISLPENHAIVGVALTNTALVYASQNKFDEAIECLEKSTVQYLKTLPSDHPYVLADQTLIETIKQKKVLRDIFEEDTVSF